MSDFSVRLIIDATNRQWILGKMAERLAASLQAIGVSADVGDAPSDDADINHWMLYLQPWRYYYPAPGFFNAGWTPGRAKHTAMITHVDDPLKLRIVRETMSKILDVGICMSRMTMSELIGHGVDAARLTYINPAHDGGIQPLRIVIGITSRLYEDGRKGEDLLLQVARSTRLDAFRFVIMGDGWDAVAEVLRQAGAEVALTGETGGYVEILERLPTFDYYLYLGWDEGSMGTLDALAAGVKTIITPQGFHLDLPGGITHAVRDSGDLKHVLQSISDEREVRLGSVRHLTWAEYARKHALVWRALLDGRREEIPQLGEATMDSATAIRPGDLSDARARLRGRLFKSELWPYFLESRKYWVRGQLSRIKRYMLRSVRRKT